MVVRSLPCDAPRPLQAIFARGALDPRTLRVLSWNIHKQADAGRRRDLRRLTGQSDLLLQEAGLDPPIRRLVDGEGFASAMASSFEIGGADIGVITASRVTPLDAARAVAVTSSDHNPVLATLRRRVSAAARAKGIIAKRAAWRIVQRAFRRASAGTPTGPRGRRAARRALFD